MTMHTHFIGIGGTGLSAMARVLLERGEKVSGSDSERSAITEGLQEAGATVFIGHDRENIFGADLAVRSSAIPEENVEVQAAKDVGIPVLRRMDYLNQLLANQKVIAVAGSHGKTTTTSMIAWMLTELNQNPGFIVGGNVENLGVNAKAGDNNIFVIEADEYDLMFHGLEPSIAIVTNVEYDHPDMFPNEDDFHQAFRVFVSQLKKNGTLVVSADDPGAKALVNEKSMTGKISLTYGLSERAIYQAKNLKPAEGSGYRFDVYREETFMTPISLKIPGKYNVKNAMSALIVADVLGLPLEEAALALGEFRGASRRFEVVGERDGVTLIDDYAHHPTEIKSTLEAAKDRYPGRYIWALWQPHTYSRTEQFMSAYATAFNDADSVIVTPVFASREQQPIGFSNQNVANLIEHKDVHYADGLTQASDFLLSQVEEGDVVLVMSAGDGVDINSRLLSELEILEEEYA